MTLLIYIIRITNMNAATIKNAIIPARSAGSILGKTSPSPWPDDPGGCDIDLESLELPPEPSSPASRPTNASLDHCPNRNGWNNCRLVC